MHLFTSAPGFLFIELFSHWGNKMTVSLCSGSSCEHRSPRELPGLLLWPTLAKVFSHHGDVYGHLLFLLGFCLITILTGFTCLQHLHSEQHSKAGAFKVKVCGTHLHLLWNEGSMSMVAVCFWISSRSQGFHRRDLCCKQALLLLGRSRSAVCRAATRSSL